MTDLTQLVDQIVEANAAALDVLLAEVVQRRRATVVAHPLQEFDDDWLDGRDVVRTAFVALGEIIEIPADALARARDALIAEYEAEHGAITPEELAALDREWLTA